MSVVYYFNSKTQYYSQDPPKDLPPEESILVIVKNTEYLNQRDLTVVVSGLGNYFASLELQKAYERLDVEGTKTYDSQIARCKTIARQFFDRANGAQYSVGGKTEYFKPDLLFLNQILGRLEALPKGPHQFETYWEMLQRGEFWIQMKNLVTSTFSS